jgi:hypothetical protein
MGVLLVKDASIASTGAQRREHRNMASGQAIGRRSGGMSRMISATAGALRAGARSDRPADASQGRLDPRPMPKPPARAKRMRV